MKNKKLLAVMVSIVILALATTVLADENSWSTGGPYGASVRSIAIHPLDEQQIYIGTLSGAWRTTDGGANWSKIEDDILDSGMGIGVIKINPIQPEIMYAATNAGAFKSIDAGESWFRLPLPHPMNPYGALEIIKTNPDTTTIFLETVGTSYRSTDEGQTWETIDGLPGNVKTFEACSVNPNTIYAGVLIGDSVIWKSTDSGATWFAIHNNLEAPDILGPSSTIGIDPNDPLTIYLGFGNLYNRTLFKTTTGGDSWIDVSPPPLLIPAIVDVAVSPLDPNTVLACTGRDGILRSTDAGQTWEPANQGIRNYSPTTVAFNGSGTAYLGFFYDGIYSSTNNGDTWEKINHNISSAYCHDIALNWLNPDTLYASTRNALYMSTDGAQSWEYVDMNFPDSYYDPSEIEVDPYDPDYIYAAYYYSPNDPRASGLARSTDGGSTWELLTNGLPQDRNYFELAVADYGGGTRRLYLGSTAGLFYSDDLGENWSLCSGLPPDIGVYDIKVSPVNPNLVFVSRGYPYELYKSTDGGDTWESLGNLPAGDNIYEIACDPVDADVVYVSVGWEGYGLYKSVDGGQTWTNTNNNLPRGDYFGVSGIAINPQNNNNIFVHSIDRGMFQSHDGGQTWEDFSEGLRIGGYAATTLIDPINTDRLFLSLYGNSVWEHTITDGGPPCGDYVVGDYNGNGIFNIADVIEAYSKLKTSSPSYPELLCDCLGDGNEWAVRMDVNNSCTFNIADVIAAYSHLKTGSPELVPCDQCPPDPSPSPDGNNLPLETEDSIVDKQILKELDKLLNPPLK